MKRIVVTFGLVAGTLLSTSCVQSAKGANAAPPAPPMPKPSAELGQLEFFRGKWSCDGKQLRSAFGPQHTFRGSSEVNAAAGGFWQLWFYQEERSNVHLGVRVQGMWGWDAASKRFTRASGDSAGQWETGTSAGFEGDAMQWTIKSSGPLGVFDVRSTFTKQSDRQWTHTLDFRHRDGEFIRLEEVTCTKL